MQEITKLTKRDIIDIIKHGSNNINQQRMYPYWGVTSELDFLSRLYPLDKMPSNDSRFKNAELDIWQHTINNDDWEYGWVFNDSRFNLISGEDEVFLNFICEMFNPIVRNDSLSWKETLENFQELLKPDGYEIFEKGHISGRIIYGWKKINSIQIVSSFQNAELKFIGEGSYAKVFRYKDNFYDTRFILKRAKKDLDSKEIIRFKREFEELKKLNSHFIIKVYKYNDNKNEYIMEEMDSTLKKYVDSNNTKLLYSQKRKLIIQILQGFKYLHSKKILHRDISPQNILIKIFDDNYVLPKISDFGLVRVPDSNLTSIDTNYKGIFNDPSLRLEGFSNYCIVHETYALTNLIYYIFTGSTDINKIKNISLKKFVEKGLSSNKEERYQSIEELIQYFKEIKEV